MIEQIKNSIIRGDALSILKRIENDSIDLFVSDPPYKVTSRGSSGGTGGMLTKSINMSGNVFNYNDIKIEEWLPEIYRILKEKSHCYIMTNNKNLHHYLNEIEKCGFNIFKTLIWDKGNVITNMYYMDAHEYIIFCRKGKAKKINNCGTKSILSIPNKKTKVNGKNIHDTEKPVELMEILISNSSNEGDLVLDCFCGAGATPIACKKLKRNYIGIELEEEYVNTSRRRLYALAVTDEKEKKE